MADEWDRLFETFQRPWKIKRPEGGGYRIEDANKRVLLYVYAYLAIRHRFLTEAQFALHCVP